MKISTQSLWNKFEAWGKRFTVATNLEIKEIRKSGGSDQDSALFLCEWSEFNGVMDADLLWTTPRGGKQLRQRVKNKIAFLRGYLVDISYDGAEFMASHMEFLTLQYPKRCHKGIALWFEQEIECDTIEPKYFGLHAFEALIFLESIDQIDFSSAHNSLPFDRIHIKNRQSESWTKKEAKEIVAHIKYDLEFDGLYCRIKHHFNADGTMSMFFDWK